MALYKDYGYKSEAATHSHSYITPVLLSALNDSKNKIILDLGCGNGAIVKLLINNGFEAYGLDASEQGIDIAKKDHPNNFELQDLSSNALPIKFQKLDFKIIIATEVIEHLYSPRDFISFCKKILASNGGGELILTTPYHGYFKNLLLSIFNKWDFHANPLWDGGHIKLWSIKTIYTLLEEQGFVITDFKGCGRLPYLWKSMLIKSKIKV